MNGGQTKRNFLQDTELFSGMYPAEITYICSTLQLKVNTYPKGMTLLYEGDPISRFGLVASGVVQVSMTDINGNRMVMANVGQGSTFAESHACIETHESPLRAVALENCSVFWFNAFLLRDMDFRCDATFARFCINFMEVLARRNLAFNNRIQILSKKTMRDKLITYFSQQIKEQKSTKLVIDMDRNTLADYIGVDRSALSRELARMKADSLIDYNKNRFTIMSAAGLM